MQKEQILENLRKAIATYSAAEEAFGDDPYMRINPTNGEAEPVSAEEVPEEEDGFDYYSMLDLTAMDPANPGHWIPDPEALDEIADGFASKK